MPDPKTAPPPFWAIERRLLAYLDQRGPTHRREIVVDLAPDDSRIGWRRDRNANALRGSDGGVSLLMGAWARRLIKRGWVQQVDDPQGWYRHHEITPAGRRALREEADV